MKTNALIYLVLFTGGLLAKALPAAAQDYSYRYAYLRHVEGEVTLQRASEPEPEPGEINVPLLPGDRVWTHENSRAEVAFADGTLLRLAEGTKVDFVEFDSEQLVRVWSGSVILKPAAEPRASLRIDAPAASVYPASEGTYRIDVEDAGAASLSVYRGAAELASAEGSVLVRSGEASFVEVGRRPDSPFAFNTARYDDFDAWSDERDRYASGRRDVIVKSLPHEVHHYADDLSRHGDWRRHDDHGYVWYPRVSVGWAPYRYGRWCYTSRFGYTWVSHDPWGWAPFHYGRWGFGLDGWYWIPSAHWGPAWVSFAYNPFWIGWSPLGHFNRPVFVFNNIFIRSKGRPFFRGGKAVPRHVFESGGGWNFVHRDHFGSRAASARLRAADVRASAQRVRFLDSGAILDRDLRPRAVGATAVRQTVDRVSREGVPAMAIPREGARSRPSAGTSKALANRTITSRTRGQVRARDEGVRELAPAGRAGSEPGRSRGEAVLRDGGSISRGASGSTLAERARRRTAESSSPGDDRRSLAPDRDSRRVREHAPVFRNSPSGEGADRATPTAPSRIPRTRVPSTTRIPTRRTPPATEAPSRSPRDSSGRAERRGGSRQLDTSRRESGVSTPPSRLRSPQSTRSRAPSSRGSTERSGTVRAPRSRESFTSSPRGRTTGPADSPRRKSGVATPSSRSRSSRSTWSRTSERSGTVRTPRSRGSFTSRGSPSRSGGRATGAIERGPSRTRTPSLGARSPRQESSSQGSGSATPRRRKRQKNE